MPLQRVLAVPADSRDLWKQQADGTSCPDRVDLQAVLGRDAGRQRELEALRRGGRVGRQRLRLGGGGDVRWRRGRSGRRGLWKCDGARAWGGRSLLLAAARRLGALGVEHGSRNGDGGSESQPATPPVV